MDSSSEEGSSGRFPAEMLAIGSKESENGAPQEPSAAAAGWADNSWLVVGWDS